MIDNATNLGPKEEVKNFHFLIGRMFFLTRLGRKPYVAQNDIATRRNAYLKYVSILID